MDALTFLESFNPIWVAIPLFTILVFAEMFYARATGRARFEARDSAASRCA
jgi:hypothetical protein